MPPTPETPEKRQARPALTVLRLGWLLMFLAAGILQAAEEPITSSGRARTITYWDHRVQRPLELEAVVTLVDREKGLLVVQDEEGALALHQRELPQGVEAGRRVRVKAVDCRPVFVAEPDYPFAPRHSQRLNDFETPANWSDQYVDRCRALLAPPQTGEYRFWISSDDSAELWLGTGAESAERIARVDAWTRPREWEQAAVQVSRPLMLEAGRTYYLESVHEQRGGRSHLSVAWEGPGLKRQVIGARHLRPLPSLPENPLAQGPLLWEAWKGAAVDGAWRLSLCHTYNGELSVAGLTVQDLGPGPLPMARELEPRELLTGEGLKAWSVVEGAVEFLSLNQKELTLELGWDNKRIQVVVQDWHEGDIRALKARTVRVMGVPDTSLNSGGKQEFSRLVTPSASMLRVLPHSANNEDALSATILDLVRGEPKGSPELPLKVMGRVLAQTGPREFLLQDTGSFRAYVSKDRINWEQVGPAVDVPMEREIHAGLAMNSASSTEKTTAHFEVGPEFARQARLQSIGYPETNGRLILSEGLCSVEGAGRIIWNSEDQFQFVHQSHREEGEFVARILPQEPGDPEAKTGIMMRGGLDEGASFVGLLYNPAGGLSLEWRKRAEGTIPKYAKAHGYQPPCWLKLVRSYTTLSVVSGDAPGVSPGQTIEVIGYLSRANGRLRLVDASSRPVSLGTETPQTAADQRPLVQIASLGTEQGRASAPDLLKVQGVVTFSGQVDGRDYLAVQDESGGSLFSLRTNWDAPLPPPGKQVEIHCDPGRTGHTATQLVAETILLQGEGRYPAPVKHPLEYLLPKKGEGAWIESEGIVRSVTPTGLLQVRDAGELVLVHIRKAPGETLAAMVDSRVRFRGVLCHLEDQQRLMLVPSLREFSLLEPGPENPFELPLLTLGSLGFPKVQNQSLHRIKTTGVVTFANGKTLYIQDGAASVRVESTELQASPAGTTIEVVGFPDMTETGGLVLAEAVTRPGTPLPPPVPARLKKPVTEGHDGQLARITGELVRHQLAEASHRVFLQSGGEILELISVSGSPDTRSTPEGSLVEATGILVAGPEGRPWLDGTKKRELRLLLRNPDELVVLQKPRWWVVKRTLLATGALALAGLLTSWWIQNLRRRVAQRTAELEQAMAKLKQETQTAATLSERNRLAGEIHDSLEQGFSGLLLQLDTTARLQDCPADVKAGLTLARNMVAFSRAEVQHAVWDLQSPLLENSSLQSALEHLSTQLGNDAVRIAITCRGQTRRLAPADEHHLLRIAQEAVTNAVKHAEAKLIEIEAVYGERAFTLTVSDNGRGFDPTRVLAGDLGHFGLRSLRGRARKINGDIEIHSEPGKGTRITVHVPTQVL